MKGGPIAGQGSDHWNSLSELLHDPIGGIVYVTGGPLSNQFRKAPTTR